MNVVYESNPTTLIGTWHMVRNREVKYIYGINDGMLVLDGGGASDGPCYSFKKPQ